MFIEKLMFGVSEFRAKTGGGGGSRVMGRSAPFLFSSGVIGFFTCMKNILSNVALSFIGYFMLFVAKFKGVQRVGEAKTLAS